MKIRTMVVEQDPTLRGLITQAVQMQGHEVLSYSDPAACLVYGGCHCRQPAGMACADIIIADNGMPKMDGIQFIRRQLQKGCQANPANKAVMSASWQPQDLNLAAALGCKVFTKPFEMRELTAWLKECETRIARPSPGAAR